MQDPTTEAAARLFETHGSVEELRLDDALQMHLRERGTYDKHVVTLTEIAEVHVGSARYFLNRSGRRAPILMIGPTATGRMLCVPLEPTEQFGVWHPVTAFEANFHDKVRYIGGNV